jgi:transposase
MMSKRRNKNTLPNAKDQRIAELEQQLTLTVATIEKLQKQVELLRTKVEELEQAGKRQAAPFARRKLVEKRKRPGRKAGQGKFAHRAKPNPKEVNETKVARLHGCPECGGKLREIHKHEQFEVDIPPVEPVIT